MAALAPAPRFYEHDQNGDPLVGGKVYTYLTGTSTPLATFTDAGGGTPNTNPVILDSAGRANIWLSTSSLYRFMVYDADDVLQYGPVDSIGGAASVQSLTASSGSSLIGFIDSGTGAVARTQQSKDRDTVSIADYAVGDGTDESTQIQRFFNAAVGRIAIITPPSVAWGLGSTGVVLASGRYLIEGAGRDVCNFTYSGTGTAIDCTTNAGVAVNLGGISVTCSNDAAVGISLGNSTQSVWIRQCAFYGSGTATNTGDGILLDGNSVADQFSGQIQLDMNYVGGFKYGLRATGGASARTWTTISGSNNYFIGRSAGIVAASRGIRFANNTNGVGSVFNGGTIESFAIPIEVQSPSLGLTYTGDMEGNTTDSPSVATSASGMFFNSADGRRFNQAANSTTNLWYQELYDLGVYRLATYFAQESVVWTDSGLPAEKMHYVGPSSGASRMRVWGVYGGASFATPQAAYTVFGKHRESYASAAPTGGAWFKGDKIWNEGNVASGQPMGWTCSATGTFGSATDNTGDTDGSTAVITGLTDTSDFALYDFVNASAGFAVLTGLQIIDKTATTLTVDRVSNAVASNITIDTSDPTFIPMANFP